MRHIANPGPIITEPTPFSWSDDEPGIPRPPRASPGLATRRARPGARSAQPAAAAFDAAAVASQAPGRILRRLPRRPANAPGRRVLPERFVRGQGFLRP